MLEAWHITDNAGRSHWVYFKPFGGTTSFSSSQKNYQVVVDRVVLENPSTGGTATYKFVYANDAGVVDTPSTVRESCYGYATGYIDSYDLPLLRKVELPGGSDFRDFKYVTSSQIQPCAEGVLTQITLPTKGRIAWDYASWTYPQEECTEHGWFHTSTGVSARKFLDADGVTNLGTWTYQSAFADQEMVTCFNPPSGSLTIATPQSLVTTITTPSGNKEKAWFSGWNAGSPSSLGVTQFEYGQPQARAHPDGSGTRYLSKEFFDCSSGSCPSSPSRREFIRWVTDTQQNFGRIESENTVYDDGTSAYEDRSDFDGYGHFRTRVSGGTYPGSTTRTTYTNFNPGSDSGGNRNGSPAFTPADNWVLGTWTEQRVTESGATLKTFACFQPTTGFLERTRVLKRNGTDGLPVDAGGEDLLAVFTRDSGGNLLTEQYYGGDARTGVTPLGTTDLCSLSLPTSSHYRIGHTYDKGVLKTSQYYEGSTAMPFKNVDRTIGLSGAITEERDVAGLSTAFTYDDAGRISGLNAPGLAAAAYNYPNAAYGTALTPASATATQSDVTTRIEFDALGRIWKEYNNIPVIGETYRTTTYDLEGRRHTVSEWASTSTANPASTTWTYDGFGRPKTIISPDTSQVTYQYTGRQKAVRSSSVQTTTGPATVTVNEYYDHRGRLTRVEENSGSGGELVTTRYTYDAGDRLTAARMTAPDGTVQPRIFDYDGRGFLRWESQPESGMKSYTYDARGHMTSVEFGAARTMFDLKLTYDAAERLRKVEARDPNNTDNYRIFKEFEFGVANIPGTASDLPDYRLGKLVAATRYNYSPESLAGFPSEIVRVTEEYAYKDAAGRKTDRVTTIATSFDSATWREARSIEQSVGYNTLGLMSKITYPMCVDCGVPPGYPWRDTTSTYTNGRLTAMSQFVDSISYWPNGMRHVMHHTNDMADTQQPDASGIPRPGMLKSELYKPCQGPRITSQTLGAVRGTAESDEATLEVVATGTPPLSYKWYDSTNFPAVLLSGGDSFIKVKPTSTRTYYAEVKNDCMTQRSKTMTVKYGDCVQPWISEAAATRNVNGTFTLSVAASGTGTLGYVWRRTSDNVIVGSAPAVTTGVLSATTQYSVTVTNSCGGSGASQSVSAVVPTTVVSFPITADKSGAAQVTVSWSAVPGATQYDLYRRDGTTWLGPVTLTSTQYVDPNVSADRGYAYRITARDGNTVVGQSLTEVVTTVAFTPVYAGVTDVSAASFNELLRSVNAVRELAGWTALTWPTILSPSDPLPNPGTVSFGRHLLAIRVRLSEALQAVGTTPGAYTDSDLQGVLIRAVHITEIQNRLN